MTEAVTVVGWITCFAALYLIIGLIHASTINSDKFLTLGQFWSLVFRWPWKGTSWI